MHQMCQAANMHSVYQGLYPAQSTNAGYACNCVARCTSRDALPTPRLVTVYGLDSHCHLLNYENGVRTLVLYTNASSDELSKVRSGWEVQGHCFHLTSKLGDEERPSLY